MSCCPTNKENRNDSTVFNYQYNKLKNLTNYKCEPECICRVDNERSNWDRIQFDWSQKGEKPHIQPASKEFEKSWNSRN